VRGDLIDDVVDAGGHQRHRSSDSQHCELRSDLHSSDWRGGKLDNSSRRRIDATPPREWRPAERFVSRPGPKPAAPDQVDCGCRCRSLFLEGDERSNAGALHDNPHATSRASEQMPEAEQPTSRTTRYRLLRPSGP
jgi:hypothetical protein